jgi:hypothetical protein
MRSQDSEARLKFTPEATGARSATLQVNDDGGGSPQTVRCRERKLRARHGNHGEAVFIKKR